MNDDSIDKLFDKVFPKLIGLGFALFFVLFFVLLIVRPIVKSVIDNPVYAYSEGERIGVLRKFSKKGLKYKTYEGELMLNAGMGTVKLDTFNFSVQDENLANELSKEIGKKAKLHYVEYLIIPYKVGDSPYLVDSFTLVD